MAFGGIPIHKIKPIPIIKTIDKYPDIPLKNKCKKFDVD